MAEAFRVMLRFEIKPGMTAGFEQTWLEVGKVITDHPANLGQWLMRSADEENVYHVMSDWIDEPRGSVLLSGPTSTSSTGKSSTRSVPADP